MDTSTLLLTANFFSQEKKIPGLQGDMKCPQQFMVNKNENTRAIQMEFLKEKVYIFWKLMEMLVMEVWQA